VEKNCTTVLAVPKGQILGESLMFCAAEMSNMTDLWLSGVFSCSRYSRTRFGPDPAGGAYDVPPDSLLDWGGGHPLPIPFHP